MDKHKIAIVAPVHIQPTAEWVQSLKSVSKNCTVIIVDDSDGKVELPAEWDVYGYQRQQEALGDELYAMFEPFHHSSACRNFGHYIAFKQGFDIIIGLDSDCNVPPDFISKHLEALMSESWGWVNPIKNTGWFPRGFPYYERSRPTVLNIGLWEHELDVNGKDRVIGGQPPSSPTIQSNRNEIAHGMIPLCGMNFACWYWAIPAFLFLPNFDDGDQKFRRYDDIWGGYIFQKIMQKSRDKGVITYGYPIVYHDTIIDAEDDANLEEAGIAWEETFYKTVDIICQEVETNSYEKMFKDFQEQATVVWIGTPFEPLLKALEFWVKIFEVKNEQGK